MKIVTEEFLELGVDNSGAINAQQLTLLGLKESDSENFVALSLGKKLSDARAEPVSYTHLTLPTMRRV